MDMILASSFWIGLASGLGIACSYGLGFIERLVKNRIGVSDPQPRLGFWLSITRWIGLLLIASVSHSQTASMLNGSQMRLVDFLLVGLAGGSLIVILRVILKLKWHINEPRWFLLLDSGYMLLWSLVTTLAVFMSALWIGNKMFNYVLPTFLVMLQINGILRAFQQTIEQRTLRAKEKALVQNAGK